LSTARVEAYIARLNTSESFKALFRQYGMAYAWLAMMTIMLAMLATLLTGTIINVAIPQIMGAYGVGQDQAQWLSTANLAAATVGMLSSAWLVQSFGLRPALVGMMAMFLLGSVVGGLSPNLEIMILARIVQGLASGQVAPLSIAIIFQLFPPGKQGLAMGISSIGAVLAPAIGPTVGGLLIDAFNWRYVFYLGVPFSLLCIPMALMFLPQREGPRPQLPFDWRGLGLLSLAITTLLMGLTNGENEGWSSNYVLLLFTVSITAWLSFIYWQRRCAAPLLNLKIFGIQRFAIFALTAFAVGAGLYGSMYLIPLFLQLVQGMSPREAGYAMLPAGIALALAVPICGRLVDKYDPRVLLSIGVICISASFYLMRSADVTTTFWVFAWWMILGRIGIAFAFPSLSLGAVKSVPLEYVSQAAGVLNFTRQLGGAFGVNLLSILLLRRTRFHTDAVNATQSYDNTSTLEMLTLIQQQLFDAGMTRIEQGAVAIQYLAASLQLEATIIAFRDCFVVAAIVFLLTLVPTWMLKKEVRP
jgi:DHA2 family multidrug resistance protein